MVADEGRPVSRRVTVLRMSWQREDPLAVTLGLRSEPDHPALPRGTWSLLRDFLRYGMEAPTGDGDVRLRPDGDTVRLELLGEGRPATCRVPMIVVQAFLDATERVVPSGAEGDEDALDALVERLLEL